MFFSSLIDSEIFVVFFGRLQADGAQVRVEGSAKRLGPCGATVVVNEGFDRPSEAVGSGFMIFAQHAEHTGRPGLTPVGNLLLSALEESRPSQTVVAGWSEIVLDSCAQVEDLGEVVALRP
jgi:hypothetical protein